MGLPLLLVRLRAAARCLRFLWVLVVVWDLGLVWMVLWVPLVLRLVLRGLLLSWFGPQAAA